MQKILLAAAACAAAFAVATTAPTAFAAESYICAGTLNGKPNANGIELVFVDLKQVTVIDSDGSDYTLELAETNSKYRVYADYEYDGYGGSVELRVPKSFAVSGSDATEEFKARFTVRTYSELGHVGTDNFTGDCQRADN